MSSPELRFVDRSWINGGVLSYPELREPLLVLGKVSHRQQAKSGCFSLQLLGVGVQTLPMSNRSSDRFESAVTSSTVFFDEPIVISQIERRQQHIIRSSGLSKGGPVIRIALRWARFFMSGRGVGGRPGASPGDLKTVHFGFRVRW